MKRRASNSRDQRPRGFKPPHNTYSSSSSSSSYGSHSSQSSHGSHNSHSSHGSHSSQSGGRAPDIVSRYTCRASVGSQTVSLQELKRGAKVWDVAPPQMARFNLRALKLFLGAGTSPADFSVKNMSSELQHLKPAKKLDIAHSWIACLVSLGLPESLESLESLESSKSSKSSETSETSETSEILKSSGTNSDYRPEYKIMNSPLDTAKYFATHECTRPDVRAFLGESSDLLFHRDVLLVSAPNSDAVRQRYGSAVKFAKIMPQVYLAAASEPREGDKRLYPETPKNAVIEVLNAYALSDDRNPFVETALKQLCTDLGCPASKVWSSSLPYRVRRVFIELSNTNETERVAREIGDRKVEGRQLLTRVSTDPVLQR